MNHADIAWHVTAVSRAFEDPIIEQFWNRITATGLSAGPNAPSGSPTLIRNAVFVVTNF